MREAITRPLFSLNEFTRLYCKEAKVAQEEFQNRNSNLPSKTISDGLELAFLQSWDALNLGTLVDIEGFARECLEQFVNQYYLDTYGIKR